MTHISYVTDGNLALAPRISKSDRFGVVEGGLSNTHRAPMPPRNPQAEDFAVSSAHNRPVTSISIRALVASIAVVAALVAIVFCGFASHAMTLRSAISDAPREVVVVEDGDTLWSLAAAHPIKDLSTDEIASIIEEWNKVDAGLLQPGAELSVPAAVVS